MRKLILATLTLICTLASAQAQSFSAEDLARRTVERRAVEAVIWGMPAVNFDRMLQAMIGSAKGKPNQIVYWSRLPDWKNQTLTPNPDVIYLMPFFNTKNIGPMVLEIPPADGDSITGSIMDAWQAALEDVGPAGVDKGKGGKYLIVPPGYQGVPPQGYISLPSMTYQGYALLRSNLASGSDADVAKAVAYAKRIKFYPLSQADNPPPTTFVDAIDVVYDATIPYDVRFFQSLDRIVQTEPWLPRDEVMIDMLKSIGIEKGKPFNPDPKTQDILNAAAREALAWFDTRYEAGFPRFYEGRQWAFPGLPEMAQTMGTFYEKPDAYAVDARALRVLLLQYPQAPGRWPVLPDGGKGQRRSRARWCQQLPAQRARERARQAVLVSDGLRPRKPRAYSRPENGEPLLAKRGSAKEHRRFGGRLFRSQGAGGQGVELGADERQRKI
jgi:hypothetical protein